MDWLEDCSDSVVRKKDTKIQTVVTESSLFTAVAGSGQIMSVLRYTWS